MNEGLLIVTDDAISLFPIASTSVPEISGTYGFPDSTVIPISAFDAELEFVEDSY